MQHAFLDAVLPAEGIRVVAFVPKGWSAFRHEFVENNDQLVQRTQMLDDDHLATYFALASYAPDAASRTLDNTLQLKSFWVDLDFKQYKTYKHALAALQKFTDRVGVPTFAVHSGGGMHLYWAFHAPIATAQWHPLAIAFQATWQEAGLKADPVSTNAAQVLRMPGTHNRKPAYPEPRPVQIVGNSSKLYDPYDMAENFVEVSVEGHILPLFRDLKFPEALRRSHDDLTDGMGHRDSYLDPMLDRCQQVRHAWDNPDELDQTTWYHIVQLVRCTVDGDDHAHTISKGYDGYTPQEVDKKIAYLESKDIGPTTCDRFRSVNPKGCEGCLHNVTSPIVLGHMDVEMTARVIHEAPMADAPQAAQAPETFEYEPTPAPTVELPAGDVVQAPTTIRAVVQRIANPLSRIPADCGFDYNSMTGYLERRKRGSDGEYETVSIFHGFICPERVETDTYGEHDSMVKLYVQNAGQAPKHIFIQNKALADKRMLSTELLNKGVQFMTRNAGDILDLLQIMTGDLAVRKENAEVISQMGWQDERMFVVGTTGVTREGAVALDMPSVSPIRSTAQHYHAQGTLEGWVKTAEAYNRPGGEVYQFALCYGAAGLFLPDTSHSGVVLALFSRESARGKTTVGDGALSWWGDPDMIKSQASDTNNALFNRASRNKNLPIVIDEVTEKPARDLSDVVYHMSLGREKARLTSTADPREILPPWALPVITTSNVAIKPLLHDHRGDSQGLFARIFEVSLNVPFAKSATPEDKEILRDGFLKNYGMAGPILTAHILANLERFNNERRSIHAALDKALGNDSYFRFWVASCSATMAVAAAARECGLLNYDLGALAKWVILSMKAQRDNSTSLIPTADEILSRFLSANVNNIVMKLYRRTSIGTSKINHVMYWPEEGIRGSRLVGMADFTSGELHLAHHSIAKFCRDAGIDRDGFASDAFVETDTKGVRLLKSVQPRQINLGEGGRMASARTQVLSFNLRHEALADFARQHDEVIRASSEGDNVRSIR